MMKQVTLLNLQNLLLQEMINNKAYLPIYQRLNAMSTQLSKRDNQFIQYNVPKYIPLRSAMFSSDFLTKKRRIDDVKQRKTSGGGILSMDRLNFQKYKLHKQLLQNAKLHIFPTKKRSEQMGRRKKEYITPRQLYSQQFRKSGQQKSKQKSRQCWQVYLNEDNIRDDLPNELNFSNKKLSFRTNQQKFRKSQMKYEKRDQKSKEQIGNFFVNNFIKTRYKRRIIEYKKVAKGQEVPVCHIQVQKIFSNTKGRVDENWVVPWQKHLQTEDEYYNNNFNNQI